jgi:DNA-binding transcriptional LysR family regulator
VDWDDLRVFVVAGEAGSLTAAARRLGTSIATVSCRVQALEHALGLTLIERSPEGISLTQHGRALLSQAQPAVHAVQDVQRAVLALPGGGWPEPIRVSATEPVIAEVLAPALPDLFARSPGLRIDPSVDPEIVSLAAGQADVAVRFARPKGDSLVARKLPSLNIGLFACHSYPAGRAPERLDLRAERLITYDESYGRVPEVTWVETAGLAGRVAARTSSTRAIINAVRSGGGIGLLTHVLV